MTFSMVRALTVVPWLSYHLLKQAGGETGAGANGEGWDVILPWIRRVFVCWPEWVN